MIILTESLEDNLLFLWNAINKYAYLYKFKYVTLVE